jgi:VWFA-related protein
MHQRSKNLVLLAAAAAGIPLWAQEGAARFTADTRLVVLHATVVDKRGKLLTDLQQSAFHVFEDGVEQPLKIFRREDVPVSMGIVVDNSGSMRDKRRKVEEAAMALVKASNPQDEIFVVNFNDEAYLDVDFTSDAKKLEDGVARIDSRGGTAMRDAIDLAMDHLKKARRDKKVLVVVTDGNDNASEITLERLIQRAQQREVGVYTVGLLDEEERREAKRAKRALDSITEATGGHSYYPKDVDDVGKFTLDVAHEIRNQYTLAYSPSKADLDGTFRQVRVTVNAKDKPRVRTRTGYYASPELAKGQPGAPGS